MNNFQLYVNGEFCDGANGETFSAMNPFNQKEWARIAMASESDVDLALDSARTAFESNWRFTNGIQRANLMLKLAELLENNAERFAVMESTDNGKTIRETKAQMYYAARIYRFFAGYADKLFGSVIPLDQRDTLDFVAREPYGVIGIITAWNSPIALLANKLPAALAAGNCVVIKPSEHASATTLEFCKLVHQAGFPPGVVNVFAGDARIGKYLVSCGKVDKISFTGSPHVGREIAAMAGQQLTPVTLELGGKSPNIIFSDCDLNKAITGAIAGIFAATGQTCIAGSRLLVQKDICATVTNQLVQRAKKIIMGNPVDFNTEMGTTANIPQFQRILDYINIAKQEGANLVTGGKPAKDGILANGLFIEPTIFSNVENKMRIAQEEVFGPVLSIIPFDTEDEAIEIANGTNFGLASGVWTLNISRAMRMIRELRSGVVWVNTYRMVAAQAPFGGIKDSGFGRERGELGILEFTTSKNVIINFSDDERDPFAMKS